MINAIVILEGSKQPYIAIGRHFGGINLEGVQYIYHPVHDAFIRKDWVKKMKGKKWEQFLEEVKASEQ
jgi:hypothetical protein